MASHSLPGTDALAQKGWLATHRWQIARRGSQIGLLILFLLGPWYGFWVIQGSLSASRIFDVLPLTDPLLLLQSLLSGHWPVFSGALGALLVAVFYALVGGRVFCSWVCPVNLITDAAAWLRRRFGWRSSLRLARAWRYWLLGLVLGFPLLTGVIVWEFLNPVSLLHRGLLFGLGSAWMLLAGVFFFDLILVRHGWCGHLCPVGAFYGLLGSRALVRVHAAGREHCDDCLDCFEVCPEPQVIKPALKGSAQGLGPVILDRQCTNCGRCIEVCAREVFRFGGRFQDQADHPPPGDREAATRPAPAARN